MGENTNGGTPAAIAAHEEAMWLQRAIEGVSSEVVSSCAGRRASRHTLDVPCSMEDQGLSEVPAVDVPSDGNCLYHAVRQAAKNAGIVEPFGLEASAHVFIVRVRVATRAVHLLRNGKLGPGIMHPISIVGDLIAKPNQYVQYSGVIPLMAMAHMLQRTIVTLSCDGVTAITPANFEEFVGVREVHTPIAIYHCQAGKVQDAVPFWKRDHYMAIALSAETSSALGRLVASHRRPAPIPDAASGEANAIAETGTKRTPRTNDKNMIRRLSAPRLGHKSNGLGQAKIVQLSLFQCGWTNVVQKKKKATAPLCREQSRKRGSPGGPLK